jgi:hypothetical protein
MQHLGPAQASRLDEIVRYAATTSLENLLWPLLLQLFVTQVGSRERLATLAVLMTIMAQTPYRMVLLTIIVFGFVLPLLADLWTAFAARWPRERVARCAIHAGLAALVSACALWSGYAASLSRDLGQVQEDVGKWWDQQEAPAQSPGDAKPAVPAVDAPAAATVRDAVPDAEPGREPPARPEAAETPPERPPLGSGTLALLQRMVHPLYQAAILEHLAGVGPVPSLMDELRRKFRLSDKPALNEFLYAKLYEGHGVGQTTSLYYGEAVAYFPRLPFVWMVGAPLLMVLVWLGLRRAAVDAGTLFGVALWRSSFAGAVTILPALAIQTLAIAAMAVLGAHWSKAPGLRRWFALPCNATFLTLALLLLVAQGVAAIEGISRNTILIAAIAPPAKSCELREWRAIPARIDRELAGRGLDVVSALWDDDKSSAPNRERPMLVQIPQGPRAAALMPAVLASLQSVVSCDGGSGPPPILAAERYVDRKGNLPLELLALACLGLFLVTMARRSAWGRRRGAATPRWP